MLGQLCIWSHCCSSRVSSLDIPELEQRREKCLGPQGRRTLEGARLPRLAPSQL